ncbi:MAG TPA: hypothetical protein VD838_11815, partial [Anaeromyxobacteraceae bacterium]|nr:hypothetical protein [Anaeromyxobacteraceae bacterium]
MPRRVGIVHKLSSAEAAETAVYVAQFLRSKDVEVIEDEAEIARAADLVVVLGGDGNLRAHAQNLLPRFGPGPVVIGPQVRELADAGRSARAALSGLQAVRAWPSAPRPVLADELLPERMLTGD